MAFPQNIGPCTVTFNGNALGETHGDVKFHDEEKYKGIQYNHMGSGDSDGVITGREVYVEVPITNTTFAELNYFLNGATGSPGSLTISNCVGKPCLDNAHALVLTLIESGAASSDLDDICTFAYAFPVSVIDQGFSAENDQRVVVVKFIVYPNASTGAYYIMGTA